MSDLAAAIKQYPTLRDIPEGAKFKLPGKNVILMKIQQPKGTDKHSDYCDSLPTYRDLMWVIVLGSINEEEIGRLFPMNEGTLVETAGF